MADTVQVIHLQMRKAPLGEMRLKEEQQPLATGSGEVILEVDMFSFTTNNITYAAYGEAMQYWQFFPTGDPDWGQVPVWGFADVVASDVAGIEIGERFYGYFPISSRVRMRPGPVKQDGFRDDAEHRRKLPTLYNYYLRCGADPMYSEATEAFQALYRPLFITSYTLADFIADNDRFGAARVVLSSASSKTAYGTAFCVKSCLKDSPGLEVVGLTSASNREFTASLECYDRVLTYEELRELPADTPTMYVDFSGDRLLRADIHDHFGDRLTYSCVVGSAQTTALPAKMNLPGPHPQFFFAPDQILKRHSEWGAQEFNRRFGEATLDFYRYITRPENPLMKVTEHYGFEAAEQVVAQLLRGQVNPLEGHIVRLP